MKKEYKVAKLWTTILWILLPIFALGFGWLSIWFVNSPYLSVVSFGLAIIMITGLIAINKIKFVIENDKIIEKGIYRTHIFPISEIKGFRKSKGICYLVPFPHSKYKKMAIPDWIGGYNEVMQWVRQSFTDIDKEEELASKKEILNNEEFGTTIKEREQRLNKTRKITRTLNIISVIISLAFLFLPHYYYQLQVLLCTLLPILAIVIYKRSKGLIKLDEKPNSANPNLFPTIIFPALILMLRALMDFRIFSIDNFWMPAAFITIAIFVLIIKDPSNTYNYKRLPTYLSLFGLLVFSGIYSYGALITTNGCFDDSPSKIYKAHILGKRISSGKNIYYYLKLSPWGPQKEIKEVLVSRKVFENKQAGDSAIIYFNRGFHRIPFFVVRE